MASTIDPRMVMRPELCDVVRADWATDTLPDDGVSAPVIYLQVKSAWSWCSQLILARVP
jgi:hypothetical protein